MNPTSLARATWQRMRSGDWAFRIPGERWAVAFVWRTFHRGFAYCAVLGPDNYSASLTAAKVGARRACWARLGESK